MNTTDLSRSRQSVVDVEQKNHFDALNAQLRQNKTALTSLRRENKELQQTLQQCLRGQQNVNTDDHYHKEEELLSTRLYVLKRNLNDVRGKNEKLAQDISGSVEDTEFLGREGDVTLNENSAVARKTRTLENRLDRCLIKHNEANAVRRTYETVVDRLSRERLTFDTQTKAIEKMLNVKREELAELKTLSTDAKRERDDARDSVTKIKAEYAESCRQHKKDINERMQYVQKRKEHLEKEAQKLRTKLTHDEDLLRKRRLNQLEGTVSPTSGQPGSGARGKGAGTRGNDAVNAAAAGGTNTFLPPINKGGASNQQSELTPAEIAAQAEKAQSQRVWYVKLRDVTLSSNVQDVIRALTQQTDSEAQLESTKAELMQSIDSLRAEQVALEQQYEEVLNGKARTAAIVAAILATRNQAKSQGVSPKPSPRPAPSNAGTQERRHSTFTRIMALPSSKIVPVRPESFINSAASMESRARVLDEYESYLSELRSELDKTNAEHDEISQVLVNVQAGIEYIASNLGINVAGASLEKSSPDSGNMNLYRVQVPIGQGDGGAGKGDSSYPRSGKDENERMQEILSHLHEISEKLTLMLKDVSDEDLKAAENALKKNGVASPENNCRVPVQAARRFIGADGNMYDSDDDSMSDDENNDTTNRLLRSGGGRADAHGRAAGDPYGSAAMAEEQDGEIYTRQHLKTMAQTTVQREEKKAKRLRESNKESS